MRKKTILTLPTAVLIALSALGLTACSEDEPVTEVTEEATQEATQNAQRDVEQIDNPAEGFFAGSQALKWQHATGCTLLAGDYLKEVGPYPDDSDWTVVEVSTKPPSAPETDDEFCGSGQRTLVESRDLDLLVPTLDEVVRPITDRQDAIQRIVDNPVEDPWVNPATRIASHQIIEFDKVVSNGVIYYEPPVDVTASTMRDYSREESRKLFQTWSGRDECKVATDATVTELGLLGKYEVVVRYNSATAASGDLCADGTIALVGFEAFPTN